MNELSNMEKHLRLCADKAELLDRSSRYRECIEKIANHDMPEKAMSLDCYYEVRHIARACINKETIDYGKVIRGSDSDGEQDLQPTLRQVECDSIMERVSALKIQPEGIIDSEAEHCGRVSNLTLEEQDEEYLQSLACKD